MTTYYCLVKIDVIPRAAFWQGAGWGRPEEARQQFVSVPNRNIIDSEMLYHVVRSTGSWKSCFHPSIRPSYYWSVYYLVPLIRVLQVVLVGIPYRVVESCGEL